MGSLTFEYLKSFWSESVLAVNIMVFMNLVGARL